MKKMTFPQFMKSILLLLALAWQFSCSKDDGPAQQPLLEAETVIGQWQVVSGNFRRWATKYVYINDDNTIYFLGEDELGFRDDHRTNVTISENQLTLSGEGQGGTSIYNYRLEGENLTIQLPYEAPDVQLKRIDNFPDADSWINTLIPIEDGIALWERDIDITFDGLHILGYDHDSRDILKINPEDFSVADRIPSSHSANAVEIEKSDAPNKQLFQSDNGSDTFYSYFYQSNALYFTSNELGAWIRGLASITAENLWVSSSNEQSLYRYKSNGSLSPGEVLETVPLSFQPEGLDYQNGFLYVTGYNKVFKCQTSPEFKVVETFDLPGNNISGIAFDGTHYWLSATRWEDNTNRLIKVSMP